jgi:hypothetical protein
MPQEHPSLALRPVSDLPLPAADSALLEALLQPQLSLLWGAHTPTRTLLAVLTTLAAHGQAVRVFDGGNRFDGYFVARLARRLTPAPQSVLGRIHLSRAFTCFQLAELIENAPSDARPLFALDLLATFYDESVPLQDAERLLMTTLSHLKRLAAGGPVVIGAREPQSLVKERWILLDHVQAAADSTWLLRAPEAESPLQPRLF